VRGVAFLAALASAAPLAAQAYQCRLPARVTVPTVQPDGPVRKLPIAGYTLALSWSPEFCKGRERSAADAIQCGGRSGRFGLIVHGLWPEGRGGTWPQWCPSARRPSSAEVRRNFCMTPAPRLQAHEWAKHGTCMARRPETYFKVTRVLWEGLRLPDLDRMSKDEGLTAGAIRSRFAAANPGWRREAIGLALSERGWLRELRLCYDRKFMPAPCDKRRFGPPDSAAVKIWRGL
jgi:ribonuclease T2